MAAQVAAIHNHRLSHMKHRPRVWVAGTRPAMTNKNKSESEKIKIREPSYSANSRSRTLAALAGSCVTSPSRGSSRVQAANSSAMPSGS
jgi:hypothetical protein